MPLVAVQHWPGSVPAEIAGIAADLRVAGLQVELRPFEIGPYPPQLPWLSIAVDVAEALEEVLPIVIDVLEKRSKERDETYGTVPIYGPREEILVFVDVPKPGKVKVARTDTREKKLLSWLRSLKRRLQRH